MMLLPAAALLLGLAAVEGAPAAGRQATMPRSGGPFALDGMIRQGGLARGMVPAGTVGLSLDGVVIPFASDRRFVIAFDRDAASVALLEAVTADGAVTRQSLSIARGDWRIEHVDASPTGGRSTVGFKRLRAVELARIAAARARDTGADGWRGPFAWPVTGRLSGLFGAQRVYRGQPGSFHSGADIAGPAGTPLRAPADGVVVLAVSEPFILEGRLLILDHGMGLNSAFLHLSRIDVREGDRVRRGQPIAAIGATGRASGPHMHWSLKWRDTRIDPLLVAGGMD